MRPAVALPIFLLVALAASGCGGSSGGESSSTGSAAPESAVENAPPGARATPCEPGASGAGAVRITGGGCGDAQSIVRGWRSRAGCAPAAGASHSACTVGPYRCITAVAGRGLEVICARAGSSVAFTISRHPRMAGGP